MVMSGTGPLRLKSPGGADEFAAVMLFAALLLGCGVRKTKPTAPTITTMMTTIAAISTLM
jgi:hypothetical protein